DVPAPGERRDDQGWNARARTEAVAPSRPARGRNMVPEPAIFVISDDHRHLRPLRALAQPFKHLGDVFISLREVGVSRMLGEDPDRLVEGDGRQRAGVDITEEILAILEVSGAIRGAGGKARMVVEGLMVRLEIGSAILVGID